MEPVGSTGSTASRTLFRRLGWPAALSVLAIAAIAVAVLAVTRPQTVVYTTTDLTALPVSVNPLPAQQSPSCVSLGDSDGATKLIDQQCGSSASTFRVIGRVSDVTQCVRDADLTYRWASGPTSGAVCLDYDWAAGQCLRIGRESVHKVDCAQRGAVKPDMAVIGAVDVSYCREGGIAHRVRHFTICTQAGDKDCKGKPRDT